MKKILFLIVCTAFTSIVLADAPTTQPVSGTLTVVPGAGVTNVVTVLPSGQPQTNVVSGSMNVSPTGQPQTNVVSGAITMTQSIVPVLTSSATVITSGTISGIVTAVSVSTNAIGIRVLNTGANILTIGTVNTITASNGYANIAAGGSITFGGSENPWCPTTGLILYGVAATGTDTNTFKTTQFLR